MDFEKVLERSETLPIVVDFWAPWCGPCQYLGPVLEELSSVSNGAWELLKINSDDHQDIAQRYQVKGIPAVKMIHKKEVVAEFTGALPKHQVERWLENYLPDDRKDQLKEILEENLDQTLEAFVVKHPDFLPGKAALARKIALVDSQKALAMIADVPPSRPEFALYLQLKELATLASYEGSIDTVLDTQIGEIQQALRAGETNRAVENLIELVIKNRDYADEIARKSLVSIFGILGMHHPISNQYRKRFDMALY